VSRKIGITEEQLSDLSRFENSAYFSNKEKLVLRLAVTLTRTPSDVCDEFYGELRRRSSERELVGIKCGYLVAERQISIFPAFAFVISAAKQ
jgi:hypothetical protein